jgi:hypothetical protein
MGEMVTWQNGNKYGKIDERLKNGVFIVREYDGPVGTVLYNDNGTSIFHHVHHNELTYVDHAVLYASRQLESMKMTDHRKSYVIDHEESTGANQSKYQSKFKIPNPYNANQSKFKIREKTNTLILNTPYEVRGNMMVRKK